MDIDDTHKCNLFNIKTLAQYIGVPSGELISYYDELLSDQGFLKSVNHQISEIRGKWGFTKGIFSMESIPSIDWFACQRVLIYVLIRCLKPRVILETGVYYGGNSAFALLAVARNKNGKVVSVDYPASKAQLDAVGAERHPRSLLVQNSEFYNPDLRPGMMVPPSLHTHWELIEGDSLKIIPKLEETFDFCIHDSDHSMKFLSNELSATWDKLSDNALILVDDIDWSNAFFSFCVKQRLLPLLMTDNGKDDLRVRTGIAMRGDVRNGDDFST